MNEIDKLVEDLIKLGVLIPTTGPDGELSYTVLHEIDDYLPGFWDKYFAELQLAIERLWIAGFVEIKFVDEDFNNNLMALTEKAFDYNAVASELEPQDIYYLAYIIKSLALEYMQDVDNND